MQSSHAPDYLDVANFTTAHCHEPNESTQCSQSQTPDSDNFCDREIQLIHTEVVALTSLEAMVERGLRAYWRYCWDIEVSVSEVSKYKVTANTEALLNFQNKLLLLEEVHGI